jgi:hypothetical protein
MEVFRRLSVILQKPEIVPLYPEATISHEKQQNIPKALVDEFDKFGLMWLYTFSPCFPLDGNKVIIFNIYWPTMEIDCETVSFLVVAKHITYYIVCQYYS